MVGEPTVLGQACGEGSTEQGLEFSVGQKTGCTCANKLEQEETPSKRRPAMEGPPHANWTGEDHAGWKEGPSCVHTLDSQAGGWTFQGRGLGR